MANPYVIPADQDLLNFSDIKAKQGEERRAQRHLKIWQKGANTQRAGALRRIDDIQASPDRQARVGVAEAARAALVVDRVRAHESAHKTIEKKRQMFLLSMRIETKKEEIKKIEEFASLREFGLKNSQDMLLEDMSRFNDFWDDCKRQNHDAMKELNKLNTEKTEINHDIDRLTEDILSMSVQTQKHAEMMEELEKHRAFVDAVLPNTALKDPKALMVSFDALVETNLMMIQTIQDIEQDLEQVRQEFARNEAQIDQRLAHMRERREELARTIEERGRGVAGMELRLHKWRAEADSGAVMGRLREGVMNIRGLDPENRQTVLEMLEDVEYTLDKYLRVFQQLEQGKRLDAVELKAIGEKFLQKELARRDLARAEAVEAERLLTDEKSRQYKERSVHPVRRRLGRLPMIKTKIPEKRVKKVAKVTPQEELDRQEFLNASIQLTSLMAPDETHKKMLSPFQGDLFEKLYRLSFSREQINLDPETPQQRRPRASGRQIERTLMLRHRKSLANLHRLKIDRRTETLREVTGFPCTNLRPQAHTKTDKNSLRCRSASTAVFIPTALSSSELVPRVHVSLSQVAPPGLAAIKAEPSKNNSALKPPEEDLSWKTGISISPTKKKLAFAAGHDFKEMRAKMRPMIQYGRLSMLYKAA